MAQTRPILYHMPQTRSGTTHWMNEELGMNEELRAPCEIRLINLKAGEQTKPSYCALNPMAKAPTLVHGDIVVTEAAAICAYLADAFPNAKLAPPAKDPKRGTYFRWMFFAPSCIEPMMLDKLSGQTRENAAAIGHGDYERVIAAIKTALSNGPYILGDTFSAADVVFGSTLNFGMMFGAIPKEEPFASYVEQLMARPAAKRASEKNEIYMKELGL